MQYNKYAIALVLLASSAFASVSTPDFTALAKAIVAHMNANTTNNLDNFSPSDGLSITAEQLGHLKKDTALNLKEEEAVKKALKEFEDAAAAARENEITTKAADIFAEVGRESDKKFSTLLGKDNKGIDQAEIEKIKDFENDPLGRPFIQEDIANYLRNKTIPNKVTHAEKIISLANGIKVSDIDIAANPGLLDENQHQAIGKVEDALSRSLTENEIKAYFPNKNFKGFDVDVKAEVLLKLAGNGKVSEISNLSDFAEQEQITAITAGESSEKISKEDLIKILAPKPTEPEPPVVVTAPNPQDPAPGQQQNQPNALVEKIKAVLPEGMSFDRLSEAEIQRLSLSAAQVTALKDKKATSDKVEEILRTVVEPNPAENKVDPKAAAEIEEEKKKKAEADALKAKKEEERLKSMSPAEKVKNALKDGKTFDTLNEEEIEKLGLTKAQVAALKAAKATGEKVDEILSKVVEPTVDKNVKTGGSGTSEPADATPFYQTTWFICIAGILVVGAIGGGAYMMTHKTEETDL